MDPLTIFYISMSSGFKNLFWQLQCIKEAIWVFIILFMIHMLFSHTNIQTWLQKAKWGIMQGVSLIDRKLIALVDNREK